MKNIIIEITKKFNDKTITKDQTDKILLYLFDVSCSIDSELLIADEIKDIFLSICFEELCRIYNTNISCIPKQVKLHLKNQKNIEKILNDNNYNIATNDMQI